MDDGRVSLITLAEKTFKLLSLPISSGEMANMTYMEG
jgi:hypothetical protein